MPDRSLWLDYEKLVPNVSEKTLYRDLKEMVKKGILKEYGEKRGRGYTLR